MSLGLSIGGDPITDINSSPTLSWAIASDSGSGTKEYQVQIHLVSDDSIVEPYSPLTSGAAFTTLSSLNYLTDYYFKIRQVDNAGNFSQETTSSNWKSYNPPPQTIDDGAALKVGSWNNYGDVNSWSSQRRWISYGAGSNSMTWIFNSIIPGQYRISASYRTYTTQATNAEFLVYDNDTFIGSAVFDQKNSNPSDRNISGVMFDDLGIFTISNSTIYVVLTDQANGEVTGDAVHIERVGN